MPRLLLILPDATYRAADMLAGAKRLGAEVVVASRHRQAFARDRPDSFLEIDLDDPEQAARTIAEYSSRRPLDAVVAVDDQGLPTAALAAERLGLVHNPPSAVAAAQDKVLMRDLLAAARVSQPAYVVVRQRGQSLAADPAAGDPTEDRLLDDLVSAAEQLGWPVVVKPTRLSGSRGVIRADDPAACRRAGARALAIAVDDAAARCGQAARRGGEPGAPGAPPELLVESFVAGTEIALEGILRAGALEVLAVFDKPDPLDGPYFEETIYVTPSRLPAATQAEAASAIAAACAALGLAEGPVHAELRVPSAGGPAVVIEVAARTIGGRCASVLRFARGRSLEELVLAHALGPAVAGARASAGSGSGSGSGLSPGSAAGVMMIPIPASGRLEAVEGTDEARRVAHVTGLEITVPIGRPIQALPEGDRYLGFLFARAATPALVEEALRAAHDALRVRITPLDQLASTGARSS